MPMINREIDLALTCSKDYLVLSNARRDDFAASEINAANVSNVEPAVNVSTTSATFKLTDTKLYISVLTLSKENDKKLLEQLKSGFKRTVKWNKYRSQMTVQSNNNNLNYLIDPTLTRVNRRFVLSFERIEENNVKKDHRDSFSHYYVPNVEIKDFNVLIDGMSFF